MPARLTSQSDPLYTSFQPEIFVFPIFTISSKLDSVIYNENFTNVHFISMNRQQNHTIFFCYNLILGQLLLKVFYCGKGRQNFASNGLFQKISTSPQWTTLNWVPKNFRVSKKDMYNCSFCRILEPADSKSWVIPEFRKNLNAFPGIPVKIYKILEKFVDFKSYALSISYRISIVVHGGVWIFSGIAQCHLVPLWAFPPKSLGISCCETMLFTTF